MGAQHDENAFSLVRRARALLLLKQGTHYTLLTDGTNREVVQYRAAQTAAHSRLLDLDQLGSALAIF